MRESGRAGWAAAPCGLLLLAHAAWLVVVAAVPRLWVGRLARSPGLAQLALALLGGESVLLLASGVVLWLLARRRQAGTPGRGRLMGLGATAALLACVSLPALGLLLHAALEAVRGGLVFTYTLPALTGALAPAGRTAVAVLGALCLASVVVGLLLLLSSWFLIAPRLRRVLWVLCDGALVVGTALSSTRFTLDPADGDDAALMGAVLRLTVTSLFASRVVVRLLPPAMNAVETIGFRPLVASRHLRARKSGFLAVISSLSTLAVAVSSCMLVSVLSVMGGFRHDLKRKILGSNAHVVADVESGGIEGWLPLMSAIRAVPGVAGAAPFVAGEVMVTSASNNGGAVLRGIDPDAISAVSDLEENLTSGRLAYLVDPEKLLHLPPEERRRALPLMGEGSFLRGSVGGEPEDAADEDAPDDGADEDAPDAAVPEPRPSNDTEGPGANRPADGPAEDPEAEARLAELEEFLKDEAPADPAEVLPGVIIGQELARSLRVYVGDEIDIISPLGDLGPTGPIPKTRPFRVAGVFYSGMYEYDMKYIYVTLESAQAFLGVGDAIRGVEIKVEDPDEAPVVAAAVRALPDAARLRVRDWQEMNQSLFGALELEKLAMFITLGIAILIAGFCVFGTLTLMVQEKGREVGILKAMGTSGDGVLRIFLIEGLMIGILGAGLGLGLGYLLTFAAEHFGIRLNAEVYYIDKLPVHVDPAEFTLVGIASILVCVLATVVPAVVASRLRPVDALRYE